MWEKSENNCKCSERCKPFVKTEREREIESQSVESPTLTWNAHEMTPTTLRTTYDISYIFADINDEETAAQFCDLVSEGEPSTYTDAMCS